MNLSTEAPLADAPLADAPLADAPLADAPLADVPLADAPLADAPLAEAPRAYPPCSDAPMQRYAAAIEYDGSGFSGWQSQRKVRTVQDELEKALSRVADHTVSVMAAGRTDRGVHALHQVFHFDSSADRSLHAWQMGANTFLPGDLSLLWVRSVPGEFHARFSATARRYRYLILQRKGRSALYRQHVWWYYHPLDVVKMNQAAAHLLGEHDFSTFRAAGCQSRTPFRNIHELQVTRNGDWLSVDIKANAFLHNMVRNIVGSLVSVGSGRQAPEWIAEVLLAKDRTQAGMTAPPGGLYFVSADYPSHFGLPDAVDVPVLSQPFSFN